MADLVDLGASKLDPKTNALLVQAKGAGVSEDDAPDYGEAPLFCALGVSARPAPANENGSAQGLSVDVPGGDGAIAGARDTRTAAVYAELGPGETALHSTGENYDSRVFCKDQMVATIVGDDLAWVLDRKNRKVTLAAFGLVFEYSEEAGINLTTGKAGIQIKDDVVSVYGKVVLGGRTPDPSQMIMLGPPTGSPGGGASAPMLPSMGVFIGK